jgi:hypothetical protein
VIKINPNGDSVWTKSYGGTENEFANSIQQTTDGGYIIAGGTYSFGNGNEDVYLIKTDSLGTALWTKTFGGVENDEGNSVQQTIDGGYIVVGITYSFDSGSSNLYLIKTDSHGNTEWTKTLEGYGHYIEQTRDGGFMIVGGKDQENGYHSDVLLLKTDGNGNQINAPYCWP